MTKWLVLISVILAGALASLSAASQDPDVGLDTWDQGWGWDWGWGHMIFGSLMMILFWGGMILLVVLVVRWLGVGSAGGSGAAPPYRSARDILEERFARGEIDKDEFEERKRLLSE